jgi:F-type H+-transporting ATPase subunit a
MSITTIGIKDYIGRFISLNPIYLFVGLLEIVSEITKVISLSFRLFGNIFAGEIVLGTVSTIFAFIFPLPFLMLEVIVGLIQALVFGMLTMAFMAILTTPHHEEAKEVSTHGV